MKETRDRKSFKRC